MSASSHRAVRALALTPLARGAPVDTEGRLTALAWSARTRTRLRERYGEQLADPQMVLDLLVALALEGRHPVGTP
jgi:hypothetical protein